MLDSKYIDQLNVANQDYTRKGQHFIKHCSKDDIQNYVELIIEEDRSRYEDIDSITKDIWSRIESRNKSTEVNLMFTGSVNNVSEKEQKQWFLSFLSGRSNKITNYFFNKKLNILSGIIDLFLTVFTKDGAAVARCNFQHCLLESENVTKSNIHSNLLWFDHTLAARGSRQFSAYKIFYLIAIGSDNRVVHSSGSSLVENRFLSSDLLQGAKSEMDKIPRLLKQINFAENEVKEIVEIILALIELSQYRAQGDGKKLEFNGSGHLKKAAENLLVKEKQLRDFIINEYLWVDNKRKLKSPEIVNSEIDSFISAIYEVLLSRILERYNLFVEVEAGNEEYMTVKLFNVPAMPNFEKDKVFEYGDFCQFHLSTLFGSVSASLIAKEIDILANSCPSTDLSSKIQKMRRPPMSDQIFETIRELITSYKMAKDRSDYLQKLEKKELKKMKFLKINQHIYVDIFIAEITSFIRFDWQTFVDGSEPQASKQIASFLKLSGNSVIQNTRVPKFTGVIWNSADMSYIFPDKRPFDRNVFFVHSLVDEQYQNIVKYPIKSQINNGNLHFIQIEELTFETIKSNEFVKKYHVTFLNANDTSRSDKEAVLHAIQRLQLKDAWCCTDYIHLRSSQICEIESQVDKYHRCALKLQEYAKILLAKFRLKNLKIMSYQYREEYLEAVTKSLNFGKSFTNEYLPVLNVDKENMCLKVLEGIAPSPSSLTKMKSNEKDNVSWLSISIMSGPSILHKGTYSGSKACIFYSQNTSESNVENCLNIGMVLPVDLTPQLTNAFILRISNDVDSGDVYLDVKTEKPIFVWNVETEVNMQNRKHFPQSFGYLYSMKTYRIFSGEYFIKKLAYNTLNCISYDTFNDLVQECSLSIILQPYPTQEKNLIKAPLWISVTNCLPLINLQSTATFNLVEKQRRIIDKSECGKYVKGMYTRPRNDWLTENVSTQLLLVSLQKDNDNPSRDSVDCSGSQRNSIIQMEKQNYKTKKYKQK